MKEKVFKINDKAVDSSPDLQNGFIELIKKVESEFYGHETYGDFTEFYEESGAVIMTVGPANEESNAGDLAFYFAETDETFYVSEGNIEIDLKV